MEPPSEAEDRVPPSEAEDRPHDRVPPSGYITGCKPGSIKCINQQKQTSFVMMVQLKIIIHVPGTFSITKYE